MPSTCSVPWWSPRATIVAARCGFPASESRRLTDGPRLDPPYGRGQELDTRLLEARSGRLVVNASNAESAQVLSAAGLETVEDRDLVEV